MRGISMYDYFPVAAIFFLSFPNDLPSKPGRAFPFDFPAPFRLSFLFSFLIAILSDRFLCFAAMDAAIAVFRSALYHKCRDQCRIQAHQHRRTYQTFLLFRCSFSFFFTAFFSLLSSSLILAPSNRASALFHFSCSSIAFRLSPGKSANFSFRDTSCSSACEGFDEVLNDCAPLPEEPGRFENVTYVKSTFESCLPDTRGWSDTIKGV
jgi:hypothetical protein